MGQVKTGDTVKVHYTGRLNDGTVFDSSAGQEPLQFTVGESSVIPGFEQAIVGMKAGDTKTITIPAKEAYGSRREEMIFAVEREHFPAHIEPEVGQYMELQQGEGQNLVLRVTEVSESKVTLDANHPLAGEDLTFDLELVEIIP